MSIDLILPKLDKVKGGNGRWNACCPAHNDKSPSMSVKELADGKVLLYCFAGCSVQSIVGSIGLTMKDLNPNLTKDDFDKYKKKYSQEQKDNARLILALAQDQRDQGVKLTSKDLDKEREAFSIVRSFK